MNISYRKLTTEDSKSYRQIRLESLKSHPESFGSSYEEQSKLPKLMFEKALETPSDDRFVIGGFDGHKLIGICGFIPFVQEEYFKLKNAGTIIQMYVKAAYRGREIGLSLVQAAIQGGFELPYIRKIVLGVNESNLNALRVYQQAGFITYTSDGMDAVQPVDGFRKMIIHHGS